MMKPTSTPGVINANEAYTLSELKLRLKIGEPAWWALRDAGMPIIPLGKSYVVLGRHVLETLEKLATTVPPRASGSLRRKPQP